MAKFMVPLHTTCQNWPATMFCFFFLPAYSLFLGRSRGLVVSTLHIRCGYSCSTPPLSAHECTMMKICSLITSLVSLDEESSLLSPFISLNYWHTHKVFCSCAVLLCQTIFPRIIAIPWLIASLEKLPPLDRNIENNRLPQIISHPHPFHHLLFLLSPSCQVEVESDPAKLISDCFFKLLTPRILTLKINQGTKFGTLTKIAHVKFIWCDHFFYFMGW